jgi:peptidoglycan/LPS O-acetylase OafA/YrhL
VPLEAMRGIAAGIVVLYHSVLSFTQIGTRTIPHGHGLWDLGLQFIIGLINGGGCVAIFFVLSGFLTTLPFAKDRSAQRIFSSLLKRWPRLAGLTVLGCLFSWALLVGFGGVYKVAGGIIGSGWLTGHANGPMDGHEISPLAAAWQGVVPVFTTGGVYYDPPLWTMRIELWCSMAAFLVAPLLFVLKRWDLRLIAAALGMLAAGVNYPFTYFTDFLVGILLALAYTEGRFPRLNNAQAALVGVLAVYFFSFTYEQVLLIHAPLKAIIPAGDTAHYMWDIAAALFMLLLLGHAPTSRFCSGAWALWLGRLSFPIYLLHVPLFVSVGAVLFLTLRGALGDAGASLLAIAVCVTLAVMLALPAYFIDQSWTKLVNRVTGRLFTRHSPA